MIGASGKKLRTEETKSMKTHTQTSWLKASSCQQQPVYIGKLRTNKKKKKSCQSHIINSVKHKTEEKIDLCDFKSPEYSKLCSFHKNKCNKDYCQKKESIQTSKYNTQQAQKLRSQNVELLQRNQHLLYEKQYLKQKLILREVQCRDLQRKLDEAHEVLMETHKQKNKKHKKNRTINEIPHKTQKSQMLLSGFEDYANILGQKTINNNSNNNTNHHNSINVNPMEISWAQQTQDDFNYLLESVQKQNNEQRKATLRKMLANKAMEMKKINKVGKGKSIKA